MEPRKHFLRSRTFGVATLNVVILHFLPGAKEWVAENPEAYAEVLSIAIVGLRFLTKEALTWKRKTPDDPIDFTGLKK